MPEKSDRRNIVSVNNSVLCIAIGRVELSVNLNRRLNAEEALKESAPKLYHPQLDLILQNSEVSPAQLRHARRVQAIGYKGRNVIGQFTALDYSFGTLCQTFLVMYLALCGWFLFFTTMSTFQSAIALFEMSSILVCMVAVHKLFFAGQHTAREAMKALEQHDDRQ